ncbi:MAG: hypothetical protein RLY61_658 [Candidatus Parcubacteria bacterium]
MKIRYSKTVLTRELFEIDEKDKPVFDQLFDYTDNKGSELVDMIKSYDADLEPKTIKPAELKLLAPTIKLSNEHQQQVNELFKPDFTPDNDGKWDEAIEYVKTEWDSIKYCIVNRLPLYMIGAVQLGKTIIYNAIALLALKGFTKDDGTEEPPLVELVLITTNNLTSSGKQNQDRSVKYLENPTNNIPVHNVLSFGDTGTVRPKAVIQSLTNNSQIEKFRELIERSIQKDKNHFEQIGKDFTPWNILVLHDEADQANANIADNEDEQKASKRYKHSLTEYELNQLLRFDIESVKVSYVGISATMLSVLANYKKFGAHRYGPLRTEQIISVPIPTLYKGFVTSDNNGKIIYNPDFAKSGLEYEDPQWFKSGKYVPSVKPGDKKVRNPKFIAEEIFNHYNDNDYQALQIATVNVTRDTKGHTSTAKLIEGEMNLLNTGSAEFIKDLTTSINITKEYVVITHNGELDSTSASEKIEKIYESSLQNNIKLKGIVIVGGWLVSRAISFGTEKYPFAYCNISFTLPPSVVDKEAVIQSARCSGRYPDSKTHTFYTSTGCIDAVKNYIDVLYNDFLPVLRQEKIMTLPLVSDYITKLQWVNPNGTTKSVKSTAGTNRASAYHTVSNGSTSRSSNTTLVDLDNNRRQYHIDNGVIVSGLIEPVIAVDECLTLTESEYNKLINDTGNNDHQAVIDFLLSRQNDLGKIVIPSSFERLSNDQKNPELQGNLKSTTIQLYYRSAKGPSVTVWQASNGTYWLYLWIGQPVGGSQRFITYNLEIDPAGKVYHFDRLDQTSNIRRPSLSLSSSGAVVGEIHV